MVPKYSETNHDKYFSEFNELIQSDSYETQRQFLTLLADLLLEKTNYKLMIRYIGQKKNLETAMNLLQNDSDAISHEAFHIFKVFVANPNKVRDIHIVFWENEKKLITFLQSFSLDKAKKDKPFAKEKKIVIKHLKDLPIPEEHQRKKKAIAKSQSAASNRDNNNNNAKQNNQNKSKSHPNVKPPTIESNENSDGDEGGAVL